MTHNCRYPPHYLFNFFVQLQLQPRQVGIHQCLKVKQIKGHQHCNYVVIIHLAKRNTGLLTAKMQKSKSDLTLISCKQNNIWSQSSLLAECSFENDSMIIFVYVRVKKNAEGSLAEIPRVLLTLMILLRHSSATILTSDSLSSLQSRNISMAMPSSFWNSGDVLLPGP